MRRRQAIFNTTGEEDFDNTIYPGDYQDVFGVIVCSQPFDTGLVASGICAGTFHLSAELAKGGEFKGHRFMVSAAPTPDQRIFFSVQGNSHAQEFEDRKKRYETLKDHGAKTKSPTMKITGAIDGELETEFSSFEVLSEEKCDVYLNALSEKFDGA